MEILAFLNNQAPKAYEYYRVFLPMWAVDKYCDDIEVQFIDSMQPLFFNTEQTEGYDYYAMSRMYGKGTEEFVNLVHDTGAQILWDTDDDLTDEARLVSGYGEVFKEALRFADRVTVTTPKLAERLSRFTRYGPTVIPNYIDSLWMQESAASVQRFVPGLTVGFAGTMSHWGDWYVALKAFKHIAEYDHVQPLTLGYWPPYFDVIPGIRIERVPMPGYPGMLKQFDVLLCALDTEEPGPAWQPKYEPAGGNYQWNEGKSAVKALEAMALGVVPMCSDIPAYRELHEAGAPIVLVEGTQDEIHNEWVVMLEWLVSDTETRKRLSDAGPAWVAEHRDIRNTGWQLWATYLRGLAARASL